jgi:hypothetical protein
MSLLRERYASSRILRISRSLEIISVRDVELILTLVGTGVDKASGATTTALPSLSMSVMKIESTLRAAKSPMTVRSCREVIGHSLQAVVVGRNSWRSRDGKSPMRQFQGVTVLLWTNELLMNSWVRDRSLLVRGSNKSISGICIISGESP